MNGRPGNPSDVGSKMAMWMCSCKGCSTWGSHTPPHDTSPGSWPGGEQQWNNFGLFQSGNAGNGGINSNGGHITLPLQQFPENKTSLYNKTLWEQLWFTQQVTKISCFYLAWRAVKAQNQTFAFVKAAVHGSENQFFVKHCNFGYFFSSQSTKKKTPEKEASGSLPVWALGRRWTQCQRTRWKTIKTMTSTNGM